MQPARTSEDLIDQMVDAGRTAVERGLVLASGGNLSARIPGSDRFLVTGAATWLDRLAMDSFAVLDLDGCWVGGFPEPSSEWKLHQRIYRMRADVGAVVHLHPQHAVLVDALGYRIRPLTLDHVAYVGEVASVPFAPNGSDELADSAAEATLQHDCVVLAHHGCSTVGADVPMAFRRAMNLEEAAMGTFRMLQLGVHDLEFPRGLLPEAQHA
ncbi:MAG: class II aldolase/adducin family protein [Nitriliruptoraceae bacterium]